MRNSVVFCLLSGINVVCNAQVMDIPTEYKLALDSAAKQQLHTCWYEPIGPLCPIACTRESRPVCALSICLGLKTFSNPCLLDAHNKCNDIKYSLVAPLPCKEMCPKCYGITPVVSH